MKLYNMITLIVIIAIFTGDDELFYHKDTL